MTEFLDQLETRTPKERAADIAVRLPLVLVAAQRLPANHGQLAGIDVQKITNATALSRLPVLRKSALLEAQSVSPPLGGHFAPIRTFSHVFQSPGPI